MENEKVDHMLDAFLEGLANHPEEEWIVDHATALYQEGIGKEGLLRLIKEQHDEETIRRVEVILTKTPEDKLADDISKSGVGGILALFCIVLIIISPARNGYILYSTYTLLSPNFAEYPGVESMTYFTLVITAMMMLFSIYAGYALWKIRPNAVRIAKMYLLTFLFVNLSQPATLYLFDLPKAFVEASLEVPSTFYLQSVIFFLIWFSYLSLSKRVKLTYSDNSTAP